MKKDLIVIDFYGKPYTSIGGYKCHLHYLFAMEIITDKDKYYKKLGYHDAYYDGSIHTFSIYPFKLCWWRRPIIIK